MYYIIENSNQLEKFFSYDLSSVYLEIITNNDNYHYVLSEPSLIYIRPIYAKKGYILSIDHTESFSLDFNEVLEFLESKVGTIYTTDVKKLLYFLRFKKEYNCIKTLHFLKTGETLKEEKYDTVAHNFYYSNYRNIKNINNIIPISKHYEKYENIYSSFKIDSDMVKEKYYKFYSFFANFIFCQIEKNGLTVQREEFIKLTNPKNPDFSLLGDKVHTYYNLFTLAGRPSNSFNNINFSSFPKNGEIRNNILSSNDLLVEYDYSSYHIKILANIIGYDFPESDVHSFLGKCYFEKEELTNQEYEESKQLTFKLLYTDSINEAVKNIPFFSQIKDFRDQLWDKYQKEGYIKTHITGRPIKNITNKNQLLPYMMQFYETERNILIIKELLDYLKGKKTKLVLYTYDSFLFDYSKKDGMIVLENIEKILSQEGYPVSIKYGKNYSNMSNI